MAVICDIARGRRAAELLVKAFRSTGIHGNKEMPESDPPTGVVNGSLEHLMFITLTVAIDYQRDAAALWEGARRSFVDPDTAYLFDPERLHETDWRKVREDMQKHRLSQKVNGDCTIWRTVGITFWKKWGGDPRRFLADCGWDAPTILARLASDTHVNNCRATPDFPYLRGAKIGPLWLRMLRDNVGLEIKNMERVPVPVDVHVARASLAMGVVRGVYEDRLDPIYEEIRKAWRESVKRLQLDGREMIALDVDESLWHLSRSGCTNRSSESEECPRREACELRELCVAGRVAVTKGRVLLDT